MERKILTSFLDESILQHFRRNTVLSIFHSFSAAFSFQAICQKGSPFQEEEEIEKKLKHF